MRKPAGALLRTSGDENGASAMREPHHAMMADFARPDEPAYLRRNRACHERPFELAVNATMQLSYGRIRTCRFVVHTSDDAWRRAAGEHGASIAALAARDASRLSALLRANVTGVTVDTARSPRPGRRDEVQRRRGRVSHALTAEVTSPGRW